MPTATFFGEFALLLAVTGVSALVASGLRQPLIVGYIAVGIVLGPSVLGWVTIGSEIELLAKVGITLLLFTVGLRLDLQVIRTMGPVSLATGLGQVLFTSVVGYTLCRAFGFAPVESIYLAVALTFSSTIIIVKLLSDKREVDSLHGRIAIGFLIIQDLVVIVVMILLTAFGGDPNVENGLSGLVTVVTKGAGLLAIVFVFMRYISRRLNARVARSPELLTIVGICWAVSLAGVSEGLGFSKEVGAFLAGVSMASSGYRDALGARLTSLRNFLLMFFFVELGATLRLMDLGHQIGPAIALSVFVLVGNPLIVMSIMGVMGYRKRTGFLAGLTVAQISEFSLMLGALGLSMGHIGPDAMGVITIVGLVTIATSTYMIVYSHVLYEWLAPILAPFERRNPTREIALEGPADSSRSADALVIGLGRFGGRILRELERRGVEVLGVDFDPDVVMRFQGRGYDVIYGDADDPEFASTLPMDSVKLLVSSIPSLHVNLALNHTFRAITRSGKFAATAYNPLDAKQLRKAGCDFVLSPFRDAATLSGDQLASACGFHAKSTTMDGEKQDGFSKQPT